MRVLIPGRGRPYVDGDGVDHSAPLAFTIDDVLTADECKVVIAKIEELGFEDAPITTAAGFLMRPDIRNNTRVMFDSFDVARDLFARVEAHLPNPLCGLAPVGANERFRCYRYHPGQQFAAHRDGAFYRDDRERSLLTFMVYLNDEFTGGHTAFLDDGVEAVPKTGSALLFQHHLMHEGSRVESGVKYVLRSDVMYR